MKIYFAGSIRGGRHDQRFYANLIGFLKKFGPVLTEHVGAPDLLNMGESHLSDRDIWQRDMDWLIQSDVVVAEVSTPSLGVGYELGIAQAQKIPVLCLDREGADFRLSAMLSGNTSFTCQTYTSPEVAFLQIDTFLAEITAKK
ncbi:nucleoside 2-deoxyribosyltransferase [bacterium]|nr:nucleoside 2-deoxyribosyltransferase [bacterium]